MKNKSKIFDISAISIIACDCLQAVICIFIDLFFVSKILNTGDISSSVQVSQNILKIGLFYVIYYLVLTSSYSVTGFALKKIKKAFLCLLVLWFWLVLFFLFTSWANTTSCMTLCHLLLFFMELDLDCFQQVTMAWPQRQ